MQMDTVTEAEQLKLKRFARAYWRLVKKFDAEKIHGEMNNSANVEPKGIIVDVRDDDLRRLRSVGAFSNLDEVVILRAAGLLACARDVKARTGPSDIVLDMMSCFVPAANLKRWAKSL